jgi:hypothetical protein
MKTYKKPAVNKLIKRFDSALKNLLMDDLKAFREGNRFLNGFNNQVIEKQFSAA